MSLLMRRPGDRLEVRSGELQWVVEVSAVAPRRGPAAEAALLYAEGDDSWARRERMIALRRAGRVRRVRRTAGRPSATGA